MRKRFTIRAKLIEGESLSSYLIRTVNLNAITSVIEIWQLVKNQEMYKVDRNKSHKLDLFPSDIVHLNDLSKLLNIQANELVLHSFEPIVSFFYPGAIGKGIFGKEIELKHRRFCRSCLMENGAFQLLWQVEEIHMCHKHLTRIESKCHRCGSEQPYVKKNPLEHLKCNCCSELLFDEVAEPIQDVDIINKQLRIYRDWNDLFEISSCLKKDYSEMFQPIHRKIAVILLFLTTPTTVRINCKKHPFFSPSQAQRLLKIVRNKSNCTIGLGFILDTLRELNIEISNLMCLKVPISFMRRVLNKANDRKIQVFDCKTEWCEAYGTVHKMVDMKFSNGKYVPKEHLYHQVCVCTDCWIKVGFSKELSKWENTNISKDLLGEINNSIDMGFSEKQILEQLKIKSDKLYFYMGYIYRYNPFRKNNLNIEDRVREVSSSTLINNFALLKPFWRINELLTRQASKFFGWDVLSTYYYYWHPKVQQYIYLEENSRVPNRKKRGKLKNDVNRMIRHLDENDIEISVKEVAASLGITDRILQYHNLSKNINEAKLTNKINKENEVKSFILDKIKEYIKNKKIHEEPILVHEIYEFLGISVRIMKNRYPGIAKFISNSAKENKSEQKLIRRKNVEKAIIQIYKQYGKVDYSLLSEYLGVTQKTLTGSNGAYKGISSLIKNIIADLEGDKSSNTNKENSLF